MSASGAEETRLLAVEETLAADGSGAARDALLERLGTLAAATRADLDKGLAPDDARRAKVVITALEAAQAVVQRVWAHFHHRS